jgi:catechol-2,3-dioxygenase
MTDAGGYVMGIDRVADIGLMSKDVEKRAKFYESIGLLKTLDQGGLKCFPLGDKELAIHEEIPGVPPGPGIGLLVSDLDSLIKRLKENRIEFKGPAKSHLGTMAVSVTDPEGFGLEFHQLDRTHPQQARFYDFGESGP